MINIHQVVILNYRKKKDPTINSKLVPYIESAERQHMLVISNIGGIKEVIVVDVLGVINPITQVRDAFPPKWISLVLLSQCWNCFTGVVAEDWLGSMDQKITEYKIYLLKSAQGYKDANNSFKPEIDRCYYPVSTGNQKADFRFVHTHYIYNDFESIFQGVQNYKKSLEDQGGGGLNPVDTVGFIGDKGQTLHQGLRTLQNPTNAALRHVKSIR